MVKRNSNSSNKKHQLKMLGKEIFKFFFSNFFGALLGGAAICLGTYASRVCEFPILAPLLFAVGIVIVMVFDLGLITRFTPTHSYSLKNILAGLIILASNVLIASLLGQLSSLTVNPPENLFLWSILGGIVIGLVSLNNMMHTPYKVALALLLMYIFVMIKLPHCVVYAFYNVDFPTLLTVIAGNIIGGVGLNIAIRLHAITK